MKQGVIDWTVAGADARTGYDRSISSQATSLPEVVYRELRGAILNGIFSPGQTLRQDEVASKLGVSRSPLREALPRLEAEGIVVLRPRRGYAVAELNASEVLEVFDLRVLLETDLARRAILARTEGDIAGVYTIFSEMAKAATGNDNLGRWFDLNTAFHRALLEPANRPHHMRSLDATRGLIESYVRMEVRLTGDLDQAQREHSEIAKAYVVGDANEFVSLIEKHACHTRDRLLAGLKAKGGV